MGARRWAYIFTMQRMNVAVLMISDNIHDGVRCVIQYYVYNIIIIPIMCSVDARAILHEQL